MKQIFGTAMFLLPFFFAYANNECGAEGPGADTIICVGGTYPSGITYTNSDGLTLRLNNPAMSVGNRGVQLTGTAFVPVSNDLNIHADSFSSISTTQVSAYGLLAYLPNTASTGNTNIVMDHGAIRTTGNFGFGIFSRTRGVNGDAEAYMNGGSIDTHGWVGIGIYSRINDAASRGSSLVVLNGGTIDTYNIWGLGLYSLNRGAVGDASIIINGGSVHTRRNNGYGAMSYISNTSSHGTARSVMNGGAILINGVDTVGIYAYNSGLGNAVSVMNDGNITLTSGAGLYGYGVETWIDNAASNADAVSEMHGGVVSVSAPAASAVYAENNGRGNANVIIDGNSEIWANAGVSGEGARTSVAQAAAHYNITVGGSARLHGNMAGGAGVHSVSVAGSSGNIDIGQGTLVEGADAILDEGGDTDVNVRGRLAGNRVAMGNGSDNVNIYSQADISALPRFDGGDDVSAADGWIDHLQLFGQTITRNGGDILNWEIVTANGAVLNITGGAIQVGSDPGTGMRVINSGMVDGGNGLALTGNLLTASGGVFEISGGGAGVYSVSGSVSNNGRINMRDGSVGDSLSITGDYTGSGTLEIDVDTLAGTADTLNIGGNSNGASTTINITNATPGLSSGAPILLVDINGTSTAGDFSLNPSGIYGYSLRYTGTSFWLNPLAVITGAGAVYQSFPAVMKIFCRVPTLRQRRGRDRASEVRMDNGIWFRARSEHSKTEFSKNGTFNRDFNTAEIGKDIELASGSAGEWVLGLNARYSVLAADVVNGSGGGDIASTAYGVGGTLTWYGMKDYLDLQLHFDAIESAFTADDKGLLKDDHHAFSYALSAEYGYHIILNEHNALIPQIQLSYGETINTKSFKDKQGELIDMGRDSSVLLRAGMAYEYRYYDPELDISRHYYLLGNLYRDFSPDSSVFAGGYALEASVSDSWGEMAMGIEVESRNSRFYTEISYHHDLGGRELSRGLNVNAGIAVNW